MVQYLQCRILSSQPGLSLHGQDSTKEGARICVQSSGLCSGVAGVVTDVRFEVHGDWGKHLEIAPESGKSSHLMC